MFESDIYHPISEDTSSTETISGESVYENVVLGGLALAIVCSYMTWQRAESAAVAGFEVNNSTHALYQTDFDRKEYLTEPLE